MDARAMQREFERRITLMDPSLKIVDKVTSDTIFSFLNAYVKRYVKQIYLQADQTDKSTRAQKMSIDSIKSLISRKVLKKTFSTTSDSFTDSFYLPDDYYLYIRSNSIVSSTYLHEKLDKHQTIANELIDIEDASSIITTPYNHIILRAPQVIMHTDWGNVNLNVIHDKFTTIEEVDLIYYRMPKPFNVLGVDEVNVLSYCELPESTHMEIVEGAVEMFVTEAKYRLNIKPEDNRS